MAYQYAKLGLAALMAAAPALAAPLPQQVTVVCVDQTGKSITCPSGMAAPANAASTSVAGTSAHALPAASKPPVSSVASATSSSAHSTTSAPANPSGGSSTGGSKKGLAYTKNAAALAQATQIAASSNGAITWMYDWEGYPFINGQGSSSYEVNGVEFVPMLHGTDSMWTSAWTSVSPAPQGKGAKHALFLNEPDLANVDAGTAASLYTSTYAPGAPSAQLGGPAVSSGPNGPTWLASFLKSCSSCKIDFMPMHVYVDSNDLSLLQTAVTNIRNTLKEANKSMPIWVTEFGLKAQRDGGNFDAATRADFINKAAAWMDTQNDIQRYSPYQVSTDGSSDSITAGQTIAQKYLSA